MTAQLVAERDEALDAPILIRATDSSCLRQDVAEMQLRDERRAEHDYNREWLQQIWSNTLADIAREYDGVDLTWSRIAGMARMAARYLVLYWACSP